MLRRSEAGEKAATRLHRINPVMASVESLEPRRLMAAVPGVPPTTLPAGAIFGTVFTDANNNKRGDAGEPGVSGVRVYVDVNGDAFGATIHDPFSCRAYFIDGNLAHTLVLFDHDH